MMTYKTIVYKYNQIRRFVNIIYPGAQKSLIVTAAFKIYNHLITSIIQNL